jgi:DNA primase
MDQWLIEQARNRDLLTLVDTPLKRVATTGGGEYAGPCPFCGGTDRFRVQPGRGGRGGQWYCRHCGGDRWHDAIAFAMRRDNSDFAGAVAALTGITPVFASFAIHTSASCYDPPTPVVPPRVSWQERARAFVVSCQTTLWDNPAAARALAWLRERNLADETIRAAGLGCNLETYWEARESWGLEPEMNNQGRPRRVWLPRGVVIPWWAGNELWRVNIRRPDADLGEDDAKYIGPSGWCNGLYGIDRLRSDRPAVMVEGEIDALTVHQAAGDVVATVATGSAGGSRRARWIAQLALAPLVLVAFDADEAGEEAAKYWCRVLPQARRWRPYWQDTNQMARDGADVRAWVEAGIAHAAGTHCTEELDIAYAQAVAEIDRYHQALSLSSSPVRQSLTQSEEQVTNAFLAGDKAALRSALESARKRYHQARSLAADESILPDELR